VFGPFVLGVEPGPNRWEAMRNALTRCSPALCEFDHEVI
jgi:hypothetical protein